MKKIKKYSFSMIELIVSIMLFSMLISFLSFWKVKLSLHSRKNKELIKVFLEEDLIYKRMRSIFSRRDNSSPILFNKVSCVVDFDYGLSFSNQCSGKVRALFKYSELNKTVYLVISKVLENKEEEIEQVVLLQDVTNINWELIDEPVPIYSSNFLGLRVNIERAPINGLSSRLLTYIF